VNASIARFIERVGLFFEEEGYPRIAGRMVGFLLVADGEHSLDEIAESLGVSKASVSTDARRMEEKGFLVRSSKPGDRRDYYAIAPEAFRHSIEARIGMLNRMRSICQDARDLPLGSDAVRERIEEWNDFHDAMVETMTDLLGKWEARRVAAPRSRRPAAR
jgi:DNA-binding transcriptional regulator GbsR (MarR family)